MGSSTILEAKEYECSLCRNRLDVTARKGEIRDSILLSTLRGNRSSGSRNELRGYSEGRGRHGQEAALSSEGGRRAADPPP